ncbi:MAG: hypothetical protein RRC34_11300 [Lentisphaeria bacterium]|nr:hypothetical protein [Lentisphaeria bacterium]
MKPLHRWLAALAALCLLSACRTEHKVELEVKPMHITIDVNVKVDKELDNFFGDLDEQDATMEGKTQ